METTLPILLDLFVATKQTEGKSPNTIIWYQKRLGEFVRYLGDTPRLGDFSINTARAFVAHLQERDSRFDNHPLVPRREGGLSPFTVHSHVRAIKAFAS